MSFAERVIEFHRFLELDVTLPAGIEAIDPYTANDEVFSIMCRFYRKFYEDENRRRLILGINPGRLGAGITGVPFTDTKRLSEECGIDIPHAVSHEPSSVFVYEMIRAYGGVRKFYGDFYINSVCPIGFVINRKGRKTNFNYYDSEELLEVVRPFIIENLKNQSGFGIDTTECFCLGTGKNYKYLAQLNKELNLFRKITPLEHPRYVVQYKNRSRGEYVDRYLRAFQN